MAVIDVNPGEPTGRRHGVALFSNEVTWNTAVTPATALGVGTLEWDTVNEMSHVRGVGSPKILASRPASTYVTWSLTLPFIQTGMKTFLLKAQRASGVLPPFTLGLGRIDDDGVPNVEIDQIQGCKIERFSISADAAGGHKPITATLSGWGTLVTVLTAGTYTPPSTTQFMTQDIIFTRAGAAYELLTWNAELANVVSRDYVIHGTAPSNPRVPKYGTEHDVDFTGSISRYDVLGLSLQASTVTPFAMVAVITNPVDSVALTFTYSGVSFENENKTKDENGDRFSANFTAQDLVLS